MDDARGLLETVEELVRFFIKVSSFLSSSIENQPADDLGFQGTVDRLLLPRAVRARRILGWCRASSPGVLAYRG